MWLIERKPKNGEFSCVYTNTREAKAKAVFANLRTVGFQGSTYRLSHDGKVIDEFERTTRKLVPTKDEDYYD